jgi:general secretion pathway protein H
MSETGDLASGGGSQAGETLIEVLVVVAILGLVAAIGFPQMQRTLRLFSQQQTVATVAARLRQARAEALRTDGPVAFAVSADGRGYATTGRKLDPTPPDVLLAEASPAGGAIVFFGDGSSTGGAVTVTAAGRNIAVAVSPGTGSVAVRRS